jgi:hypothetical protein
MGLFDFLSPWKKAFDDLASNHRDAVLAFTKNKYTVFNDMRQDHKSLFSEFRNLWYKEISPIVGDGEIENLSNEAKKYLIKNQDYIIRLHTTFKKYASKKERVRNLASRFAIGNVFKQTAVSLIGTSDLNVMSEDSYNVILANYDILVEKAAALDLQKKQRQQEVKDKLAKKIQARREKIRAEKLRIEEEKRKAEEEQRKAEEKRKAEVEAKNRAASLVNEEEQSISKFPYSFGAMVTEADKVSVIGLFFKYKHHGIFERVVKSRISSLAESYMIVPTEVSKIKGLIKDFDGEVEFFNKVKEVPDRRKKYKKLIKAKGIIDQHLGIMYCLHNLQELDAVDIAPKAPAANTSSAPKEITVASTEFELWKQSQERATNILNRHIVMFPKTSLYPTKMYVNTVVDGEEKRNVLTFPHVIFYEMGNTNLGNLNKKREGYNFVVKNAKRFIPVTLPQYKMLVAAIANDFKKDEVLFIMESSGAQKSTELNQNNFGDIYFDLKNNGYKNWGYVGNEDKKFKCVVVMEIGSEIDQFRKSSKKISKKFPGAAIIYISVYGELTDIQIKNKYGNNR